MSLLIFNATYLKTGLHKVYENLRVMEEFHTLFVCYYMLINNLKWGVIFALDAFGITRLKCFVYCLTMWHFICIIPLI